MWRHIKRCLSERLTGRPDTERLHSTQWLAFLCRGDIEKAKRKVEGDLKLTQEAVSDLERNKKELEQTIQRKDKEISSLAAKLEDEQSLVAKLQKQIKELQVLNVLTRSDVA